MKMSQLYAPTLREVPAEAELRSHQFMLRAGLMRKSTAGVYAYLPLGYRVMQKVMNIVREEMNKAGGQEVLLPILQPAELWQESGRWADYGDEMFRVKDRNKRDFCLGPTHEEIITALVRSDVRSYKQLPIRLYQIQNKYRDEIRPRFGVIRGREFIMKDLYSFDRDEAGCDLSYQAMYDAYKEIFRRCGLDARPVEADSGAIGGDTTHEFMVLSDSGEALVVHCPACGYAANVEKAPCAEPAAQDVLDTQTAGLEKVHTPDAGTIDEICTFLDIEPQQCLKTVIYLADGKPVAVLVRGDHTLNELKLQKELDCSELLIADARTVEEVTGAAVGFAGPIGLSIPIIADQAAAAAADAVVGANQTDYHTRHVSVQRDLSLWKTADLRQCREGDACPACGQALDTARGTEVGQVFKLGTKYSEPLKATFLDENGKERSLVMGCYGIGVSRTVAAVIEQHSDADGISWPISVSPYHVVIVPVSFKDDQQRQTAEELYQTLQNLGVEAVLDDRLERPGVKFKDADLIGFPYRITIGPKSLAENKVELIERGTKTVELVDIAAVGSVLQERIHS